MKKALKWIEVRCIKHPKKKNSYYWHIVHRNGNIICTSAGFDKRSNAKRAAMKENAERKVALEIKVL